ncbi:MAG: ABC transporter permease [Caldicoprobacterales bacterium]
MRDYRELTSRYLKVQKKRTLLTIIGIILSVALITSIGTMVISARDMMIKNEIERNGDYHAIFLDTPSDKVNNIKNYVGVENSALTKTIGTGILAQITDDERQQNPESPPYRYVNIKGYDKDALDILPITLKEGRLPQDEEEIILEYWVADYLPNNPKIGDIITLPIGIRIDEEGNQLSSNSYMKNEIFEEKDIRKYTIVGFFEPKFAWVGQYITTGITFLDNDNLTLDEEYNVYVKMDSVKDIHENTKKIAQSLDLYQYMEDSSEPYYNIEYNERLLRLSAQSLDMDLNNSLIGILIFIVILIIVSTIAVIYNAFHISVLERISQFGILRCVGASPAQIRNIVLKEAWKLSLIGIPIGLFSGVFAMQVVMFFVNKLNYRLLSGLTIVVSPLVFIVSAIIGLITVFLSALGPAKQAGKIPALDAVRNTGSLKKESFDKIKRSAFSRKLLGIEGEIAYKNLRRNRKRFRITVFSMIISIVLYIAFSSFMTYMLKASNVHSEEMGDFMIWHNGSLGREDLDDTVYRDLKDLPDVEEVFYYHRYSAQIIVPQNKINSGYVKTSHYAHHYKKGHVYEIDNNLLYGYEQENLNAFKPLLKKGNIDIDAINKENGVLIVQTSHVYDGKSSNGTIMDIVNYEIGDEISVTANFSEENLDDTKVKVLGILDMSPIEDPYNLNEGVIMITTKEVYDSIQGTNYNPSFLVKCKKDHSLESIRQYLKDLVDMHPTYTYMDRVQLAQEERNAATAISIFLYGFVAVITLIGSLNIINTISTNLILRTKELSMLKAIGMTQNGVKRMVSMEALFYGIIASIYGGIIGTGLSYLLYHFVTQGIQDFPWTIPWNSILVSTAGATFIALMSGFLPLRRINNNNIVDNMRMEE